MPEHGWGNLNPSSAPPDFIEIRQKYYKSRRVILAKFEGGPEDDGTLVTIPAWEENGKCGARKCFWDPNFGGYAHDPLNRLLGFTRHTDPVKSNSI